MTDKKKRPKKRQPKKKKEPEKKPEPPKPPAPPSCALCGLPREKTGPLMRHPSGGHICESCIRGGVQVFDRLGDQMKDDARMKEEMHNILVGAYVTAALISGGPGTVASPVMEGAIGFADRALGLKPQIEEKGKG